MLCDTNLQLQFVYSTIFSIIIWLIIPATQNDPQRSFHLTYIAQTSHFIDKLYVSVNKRSTNCIERTLNIQTRRTLLYTKRFIWTPRAAHQLISF